MAHPLLFFFFFFFFKKGVLPCVRARIISLLVARLVLLGQVVGPVDNVEEEEGGGEEDPEEDGQGEGLMQNRIKHPKGFLCFDLG